MNRWPFSRSSPQHSQDGNLANLTQATTHGKRRHEDSDTEDNEGPDRQRRLADDDQQEFHPNTPVEESEEQQSQEVFPNGGLISSHVSSNVSSISMDLFGTPDGNAISPAGCDEYQTSALSS